MFSQKQIQPWFYQKFLQMLYLKLPGSDKHIFSGGFKYKLDDRLSIGWSILYTKQKSRDVNNAYVPKGTFKDGGALLMAFGMDYSF